MVADTRAMVAGTWRRRMAGDATTTRATTRARNGTGSATSTSRGSVAGAFQAGFPYQRAENGKDHRKGGLSA